jgi:hypothetical protein
MLKPFGSRLSETTSVQGTKELAASPKIACLQYSEVDNHRKGKQAWKSSRPVLFSGEGGDLLTNHIRAIGDY